MKNLNQMRSYPLFDRARDPASARKLLSEDLQKKVAHLSLDDIKCLVALLESDAAELRALLIATGFIVSPAADTGKMAQGHKSFIEIGMSLAQRKNIRGWCRRLGFEMKTLADCDVAPSLLRQLGCVSSNKN